jgi:predicted dehydrogenase
LKDPSVEAVYIATPHPSHAEWAIQAAKAGKHILCEKPLTMNGRETKRVLAAVKRYKVFLLEAFAYRPHPQTAKLLELIRRGVIGEVRLIQSSFCYNAGFNPQSRIFNRKLGGGGILDIGCYPISISRLIAGACQGRPFADPIEVKGVGHLGRTGVDEWTSALLKFPGDIVAEVTCGVRVEGETVLRIHGSKGSITVPKPFNAGHKAGKAEILLRREGKITTIPVKFPQSLYVYEADETARCIRRGSRQSPYMNWADSLGNTKTLDRWLKSLR